MKKYTLKQKIAFSLLGVENEGQKDTIMLILSGEKYVKDDIDSYWHDYLEKKEKFFSSGKYTEREIEVGKILVLAEEGFSQKKIAEELGLSTTQVNTRCKKYGIITCGMRK